MPRINPITKTVTVFAVLLTATLAPVNAANPPSGTITQATPTIQWQGQLYVLAATSVPEECPPAVDPANLLCDHFLLKIDLPLDFWTQNTGTVTIRIDWESDLNDFDLYIYNSNGQQVDSSAAGGTTSEQVSLEAPEPGTYEVRVVPFLVAASDYQGTAQLLFTPGLQHQTPPTQQAEYHSHQPSS